MQNIIKRNLTKQLFDQNKIYTAIAKAFASSGEIYRNETTIEDITATVIAKIIKFSEISVEAIQDFVEETIQEFGYFKTAKEFILYRQNQATLRKAKVQEQINLFLNTLTIKISEENRSKLYNKYFNISSDFSINALILVCNELTIEDNCFDLIAVHALNSTLPKSDEFSLLLSKLNADEIINSQLFEKFDLEKLINAIDDNRTYNFKYIGLKTLTDRYFLRDLNNNVLENTQTMFMRVAMGIALNEDNPTERAIEFYNVLSQFDFMCSTPTLFNSGTNHSQLSSCYVSTIDDDLHSIFDAFNDNAQLAKWSGGLGNDWTNIRAIGAKIKGTNGQSQGVVPFLKVANDICIAVDQGGGKRKGSACAYLETWHLDIEEFLELRKNTGDDRRRTHDLNTATWIPDLFMKRVLQNQDWTLFSPNEVSDLHDLFGTSFELAYNEYEKKADRGEIKQFKKIKAVQLWRKMLSMLFETGHPWLTFKDPCNIRSPQQHVGRVRSSNLCTEIVLNTSKDEIAVCNLGSINLLNHIVDGNIDESKLEKTVTTAMRMLDNVIDINFYPVEKARNSNMRHRPVGMGIMGFQDCLYKLNISYESHEAVEFADKSQELVSYYAILASTKLAEERGAYSSYEGSLWSKGILPYDSLFRLIIERGQEHVSINFDKRLNWSHIKNRINRHGMRNSNCMAIAPTATIANIIGVTSSIEPTYQNVFTKSNLSGEFLIVNQYLVDDLKELNLWNQSTIDDLKQNNGSVQRLNYIPDSIKAKYKTAFEIEPKWLIKCGSRRQKWIDQSQSLNLYLAVPSGKILDEMYKYAWKKGLKTTYYLRTLGASHVEKLS